MTNRCPLCGSTLSRTKFERVLGLWDAKKDLEGDLRAQLKELKTKRKEMAVERKRLKREMRSQIRERTKIAAEKASTKERKRADRLAQLIETNAKKMQEQNATIKELQEQLKSGMTPQAAGLNLEADVVAELKDRFHEDTITHHGKKGDILQVVRYKGKDVASILYECKRTKRFSRSYVTQARRAMVQRNASFAVLVTTAFPPKSAGFAVSQDVFVIHPFGCGDLAEFLRGSLIEMHTLEVSGKEMGRRAKTLVEYARSDDFRNAVEDSIHATFALRDMLEAEMKSHTSTWKKRLENYRIINTDVSLIRENARRILRGERPIKRIDDGRELVAPRSLLAVR